ncbi:MAG: GGDEF domain-containing protein [Candidatus Dormibacteraeota bacterium]|nr:GGDEF domain-containing protein [Candidatus Dormibacteraeota bacterium]
MTRARIAVAAMFAVVVVRLLTLSLPTERLVEELLLILAGGAYALFARPLLHRDPHSAGVLVVLHVAVPSLIATGMVVAASGYLPESGAVAVLLFAAVHLGVPSDARWAVVLTCTALIDALFTFTWLTATGGDVSTLLIVIAFMAALQLLVLGQARAAEVTAESEKLRTSANAVTAMRVGTAIDVNGVTRAVLETSREPFPWTTQAMMLIYDSSFGRLRPLPLYLSPSGLTTLEADNLDFTLAPGEGMAGKIFASNRPMLWGTAHDIHMAQANLGEQTRIQMLSLRRGVILSAIGAPLVVDDELIGVYLLTSTRRELAWDEDDLTVVSGLAGEAARAIARARRYERELDQAHLDSITGLANHRQLTRTLDQEVARARRRTLPLGVVFCDLDRFKTVNDTFGHAAGDRVLTILARVFHDCLRREDSAARYGGDEFVCVLPGADRTEADAVGRRIASSFEARVGEDPELSSAGATISCGVAIFPDDGDNVETLLDHSDAAMRIIKATRHTPDRDALRAV